MPSTNAVERRRKKVGVSSLKVALVTVMAGLWVLVTWSHFHIASKHRPRDPIHQAPLKTVEPSIAKPTPLKDLREAELSHPHPDAKLLSKTNLKPGEVAIADSTSSNTYPPIEKLITGKWNVTGDVSSLINFAIVGFPKCGTSTMMEYLHASPHTAVMQKERCEMGNGHQADLIRKIYEELPEGDYKRGIKCPRDLENDFAVGNYAKFFPKTDFLVGMRHPVLWFQSFYNFRVYNNNPMPPAEELVGVCKKYTRQVCTNRARFHQYLANLGKTALEGDELQFFKQGGKELRVYKHKGKLFLYHVEQLKDENPIRQLALRTDLTEFLGIPEILPPLRIWTKPGKNLTQEQLANANSHRLDICHANHTWIRNYLINQAKGTAEWILNYLLKAKDVYVSSPDYFRAVLKAWEVDPCNNTAVV